ncbi:MAG: DNA cytosine methyltransferase [Acidobacteria bacterium]|nr:DNA cytosine methyltransferase [Acidobacteriota bacterium]
MIKAIDFCCGAGGLTRGLLDAGILVLAGVDIDEKLRKTYETNNAPSRFLRLNLKEISIRELRDELGITDQDLVLYAACTPCQPFSTLNQRHGEDDRKELLISFAEIVQAAPPDFIVVENVPGLNTAYGKEIYEQFIRMIGEAGFREENIYADFLDANEFGVAQVRKRFILIASRHGNIKRPLRATRKPVVRTVLKKYPAIRDGEKSDKYPNHEVRRLQPHHKVIVQAVPKDGGSRRDIEDTSILLECHQNNPGAHKDVFGRMAWNEPAPTLTCRCTDVYCGRFIHPEQDRGVSLREAAALQSFPDDYIFIGSYHHIMKQIGNAVPVKFAKRLGLVF